MLMIKITKIKLTGGHIELILIIEMAKIEFNRRPYWIYFIYVDYQKENRTLLIIETAKIEINRRPY